MGILRGKLEIFLFFFSRNKQIKLVWSPQFRGNQLSPKARLLNHFQEPAIRLLYDNGRQSILTIKSCDLTLMSRQKLLVDIVKLMFHLLVVLLQVGFHHLGRDTLPSSTSCRLWRRLIHDLVLVIIFLFPGFLKSNNHNLSSL